VGLMSSKKRTDERDEVAAPIGKQVESIISVGTTLDGDCETPGSLRVEGRVTGSIRAGRLTVATDGHVAGDITAPAGGSAENIVRIDGRVDGTVSAPVVEIGPRGSVGAGLRVRDAVVRGRVAGAIVTEHRLRLEETAIVEGDVTAQRLGLAEGGQVFGTIRIGGRPDTGDKAAGKPGAAASARPGQSSSGPGSSGGSASSAGSPESPDSASGSNAQGDAGSEASGSTAAGAETGTDAQQSDDKAAAH
jgi:cytoskeletal protein CcmA (bactofilin family)